MKTCAEGKNDHCQFTVNQLKPNLGKIPKPHVIPMCLHVSCSIPFSPAVLPGDARGKLGHRSSRGLLGRSWGWSVGKAIDFIVPRASLDHHWQTWDSLSS